MDINNFYDRFIKIETEINSLKIERRLLVDYVLDLFIKYYDIPINTSTSFEDILKNDDGDIIVIFKLYDRYDDSLLDEILVPLSWFDSEEGFKFKCEKLKEEKEKAEILIQQEKELKIKEYNKQKEKELYLKLKAIYEP